MTFKVSIMHNNCELDIHDVEEIEDSSINIDKKLQYARVIDLDRNIYYYWNVQSIDIEKIEEDEEIKHNTVISDVLERDLKRKFNKDKESKIGKDNMAMQKSGFEDAIHTVKILESNQSGG